MFSTPLVQKGIAICWNVVEMCSTYVRRGRAHLSALERVKVQYIKSGSPWLFDIHVCQPYTFGLDFERVLLCSIQPVIWYICVWHIRERWYMKSLCTNSSKSFVKSPESIIGGLFSSLVCRVLCWSSLHCYWLFVFSRGRACNGHHACDQSGFFEEKCMQAFVWIFSNFYEVYRWNKLQTWLAPRDLFTHHLCTA